MAEQSRLQTALSLIERAMPLVAYAVDVPRRELEAQQWLVEANQLLGDQGLAEVAHALGEIEGVFKRIDHEYLLMMPIGEREQFLRFLAEAALRGAKKAR